MKIIRTFQVLELSFDSSDFVDDWEMLGSFEVKVFLPGNWYLEFTFMSFAPIHQKMFHNELCL